MCDISRYYMLIHQQHSNILQGTGTCFSLSVFFFFFFLESNGKQHAYKLLHIHIFSYKYVRTHTHTQIYSSFMSKKRVMLLNQKRDEKKKDTHTHYGKQTGIKHDVKIKIQSIKLKKNKTYTQHTFCSFLKCIIKLYAV